MKATPILTSLAAIALGLPAAAEDQAAKWTTIKGQVVYAGDPPKPQEIEAPVDHPDRAVCLKKGKFFKENLIVHEKNKGLKNAWVWIEPVGLKRGEPFPTELIHPDLVKPEKDKVEIDQPCCQF